MKKKTFQVLVTTTFDKVIDVEAESEEDAISQVEEGLFNGDISDAVDDGEEPNTEVTIW